MLLGNVFVYLLVLFSCCLTVIIKTSPVSTYPVIVSIVLAVFFILFIILIGYLFIFHIYLISTAQTTNEYSKDKRIYSVNKGVARNFLYLFFGSLQPSYQSSKLNPIKARVLNSKAKKPSKSSFVETVDVNKTKSNEYLTQSIYNVNFDEQLQSQQQLQHKNFAMDRSNMYHDKHFNMSNQIDIENLYIETPAKKNFLSVSKALNLASKTANVASF